VTTYETCYATAGDDMASMLRFQVGGVGAGGVAQMCVLTWLWVGRSFQFSERVFGELMRFRFSTGRRSAAGADGGAGRARAVRCAASKAEAPNTVRAPADVVAPPAAERWLQRHLMEMGGFHWGVGVGHQRTEDSHSETDGHACNIHSSRKNETKTKETTLRVHEKQSVWAVVIIRSHVFTSSHHWERLAPCINIAMTICLS
jgi:hypothetical protein